MVSTTIFFHSLGVEIIQESKALQRLCGQGSAYDSKRANKCPLILYLGKFDFYPKRSFASRSNFFIVSPFSLRSFSLIFNLYAPHFLSYSYVINSAEFIKESFSSISGIFIDKPKKSFLGLNNCKNSIFRFSKKSDTVEVQIAMRYKRIDHFSDHLQINFHK